jgi:hypothetical protein
MKLLNWYMRTFKRQYVEIKDKDGGLYLRRFFLLGHWKSSWALMLHCFHRSDWDRHLHDHPWPFLSLILTRGYYEVTASGHKWYHPLSLLYRPATWTHRVKLDERGGPVWTLVWRGKKVRSWGFHTEAGWVYYQDYGAEVE